MANIAVKNADGTTVYLKASGAGSDVDPHVVEQLIGIASGQSVNVGNFPATQTVDGIVDAGKPFMLRVAQGEVTGYSIQDKFGFNPDIDTTTDPEDIWEGGGLYNFSTSADIISVASDNASDTQDIEVLGLNAAGIEVTQTVTLNGTTRVPLTTALWRVYRMSNEGSTNLAGTVFCYTGTGVAPVIGDANVRAVILNGNNQTQMAIYTIPLGYVGFLLRGELGIGNNTATGSGLVHYESRRYQKVFKYKKTVPINLNGNSVFQDTRSVPDVIPALTDIKITVSEVTDNDTSAFATFDVLLVDEDELDPAFLTAIGQPSSV